jgi:hypothetical protein
MPLDAVRGRDRGGTQGETKMTRGHRAAVLGAIAGALVLLAAMLFGWHFNLKEVLGVDRYLRDIAVALWAFLLPAWFTVEELWFSPPSTNPAQLEKFREGQRKARATWAIVGGAVAIVIGATAPPSN